LLDYLADSVFGAAIDINTQIDLTSFKTVADYLNTTDTSYQTDFVTWWRYIGWKPGAYSRAMMQCNTSLNGEDAVTKNVEALLSQFGGTLNVVDGKYVLSVERDDVPVASMTEADIIGSVTVKNAVSKDKWNSVQASIIDPAMDWSTNQITFFNSTYLAEDNNIRKKGNTAFSQITNYYTARSWAERVLNTSRFSRSLTFTTYYKFQYLLPNNIVTLTYARFGYSNTKFRIKEIEIMQDGLVRLTMEKFDPAGYVSSPQPEIGNSAGNGAAVAAPEGLTFSYLPNVNIPINLNGDTTVYGIFYWTAPSVTGLMRFEGDYKVGAAATRFESVDTITVSGVEKYYTLVRNMLPQSNYTFRVQTLTTSGVKSPYAILTISSDADIGPAQMPEVQNLALVNEGNQSGTFIGGNLVAAWTPRTESYLSGYDIVIKSGTTTLKTITNLSKASGTYTFTLADNMAAYATANAGAVGAYRSLSFNIYTRTASGRRSTGVSL
jgi:hypothetical protein